MSRNFNAVLSARDEKIIALEKKVELMSKAIDNAHTTFKAMGVYVNTARENPANSKNFIRGCDMLSNGIDRAADRLERLL